MSTARPRSQPGQDRLREVVVERGQQLDVLLDPGEPLRSVPASAREDGHEVIVAENRVTIVKR